MKAEVPKHREIPSKGIFLVVVLNKKVFPSDT